jgi:DNA-binding MarR family transcriptional regulator
MMDEGTRATIERLAIDALKRCGPMTQQQLASEAHVDLGGLVAVLASLARAGRVQAEQRGSSAVWVLLDSG